MNAYLERGYNEDAARWAVENGVSAETFSPKPIIFSKATLSAIGAASGFNGRLYVMSKAASDELSQKLGTHYSWGNTYFIGEIQSRVTYDHVCSQWRVSTS